MSFDTIYIGSKQPIIFLPWQRVTKQGGGINPYKVQELEKLLAKDLTLYTLCKSLIKELFSTMRLKLKKSLSQLLYIKKDNYFEQLCVRITM